MGYVQVANSNKGSKLTYLVGIMASLTVTIGYIFQNKNYLNGWVQYAVLFALVLIIIFIVHIFFSDAIFAKFNQMETKRMHNKIAQKYFPEFKILIDKFNKSIESNSTNR